MKALVIILLLIIAVAVIYFTFVIAAIKIVFGAIMLGIMLLALLGIWILWKSRKE